MNTLDEDVSLFCDSHSALQAITSGISICRPNLLSDIINLVSNYNKTIRFVWLLSHIGIKGNELADMLANSATTNSHVEVDVGLQLSEAYNLVDSYIINKWQQTCDSTPTGSHYRTIEKTVSTKIECLNASRQKEVIITRLRLGKCKLNAYLHQIGKNPDGLCYSCNKPETVKEFSH